MIKGIVFVFLFTATVIFISGTADYCYRKYARPTIFIADTVHKTIVILDTVYSDMEEDSIRFTIKVLPQGAK